MLGRGDEGLHKKQTVALSRDAVAHAVVPSIHESMKIIYPLISSSVVMLPASSSSSLRKDVHCKK